MLPYCSSYCCCSLFVDKSIWLTCEEFEYDVLSSDSCLDLACIQAIRYVTSNFIRTHAMCRTRGDPEIYSTLDANEEQDLEFSGPPLGERLTRPHSDINSLDEFCELAVEDMGVDVDEGLLEMGIVLSALQCTGSLVLVNDFDQPTGDEDFLEKVDNKLLYKICTIDTAHYAATAVGAWQKGPDRVLFGHVSIARRTSEAKDISEAFSSLRAQSTSNRLNNRKQQHVTDYALAADQGNAHAAFMLAQRYDAGDGVPEDRNQAAKYYKIAADQGNADAQFMLGTLFDIGEGVPQSESEALRYYKMSASRGNVNAQKILSEFVDGAGAVDKTYRRERNRNCRFTYSVLYPSQFFNKNYMDMRRTLAQPPPLLAALPVGKQSAKWAYRIKPTTASSPDRSHSRGWDVLRSAVVSDKSPDPWTMLAHSVMSPTTWSLASPMKVSAGPSLLMTPLPPVPPASLVTSSSSPTTLLPIPMAQLDDSSSPCDLNQESSKTLEDVANHYVDIDNDGARDVFDGVDVEHADHDSCADEQYKAATILQAHIRGSNLRRTQKNKLAAKVLNDQHRAATMLQARLRGNSARKTEQEKEAAARRLEQEKLERFHRLRKAHQAEEAAVKRIRSFGSDRSDQSDDTEVSKLRSVRELISASPPKKSPLASQSEVYLSPSVHDVRHEACEMATMTQGGISLLFAPQDHTVNNEPSHSSSFKDITPASRKTSRVFFPDSSDENADATSRQALVKRDREAVTTNASFSTSAEKRAFCSLNDFDEKAGESAKPSPNHQLLGQSPERQLPFDEKNVSPENVDVDANLVMVDDARNSMSSVAGGVAERMNESTATTATVMSGIAARSLSRGMSARLHLTELIRQDSMAKLSSAKSFFNSLVTKKVVGGKKRSKTDLLFEDIHMIDDNSDWDSDSSYSSYDVYEPVWEDEFYEPNKFEQGFIIVSRICRNLVNKPGFSNYITLNIVAAVVVIGYQSYPQYANNVVLNAIDVTIFANFTAEVILKVIAEEFKPWLFFTRPETRAWNWFDFIIVVSGMPIPGSTNLKFLRVARLLRLTKMFKRFPQLNMIVLGIIDSTSFLTYIVALWFLLQYMYAVLGIILFAENDPWHFRSLEHTFFTLLQMTTLDVRCCTTSMFICRMWLYCLCYILAHSPAVICKCLRYYNCL